MAPVFITVIIVVAYYYYYYYHTMSIRATRPFKGNNNNRIAIGEGISRN